MRSPRLLVICALVLAPVAGLPLSTTSPNAPPPQASGTNTGSPGVVKQPINNSVSHLAIKSGRINSTTIETATLDISGPVASDGSKFRRKYRIERFDAAYRNASDTQAVVDAALNRSANRTAELRERQKKAIKEYNDGTLSTRTFLRELALISSEASQIRVFVNHIRDQTFDKRAREIKGDLNAFTGPVRTRIKSTLQGDSDAPKRFFVRTSSQGVVLATIDNGRYIRETHLAGARAKPNETDSPNTGNISEMVEELYPSSNGLSNEHINYNNHHVYKFQASHGRVVTYTDRPSKNIFYERQRMSISDKRTVEGPQNTNGPFALTTNVTYPGGYMYVRLTDPETGDSVDGTITVRNETVGTTEDGELYMLQPSNGTTINATVDNETVSVTLREEPAGPPGPPQSGDAIESPNRPMEAERKSKRALES